MSAAEWLQIATLVVALGIGTRFLGAYMAEGVRGRTGAR